MLSATRITTAPVRPEDAERLVESAKNESAAAVADFRGAVAPPSTLLEIEQEALKLEASIDGVIQRLGDALLGVARANATLQQREDERSCLRREVAELQLQSELLAERLPPTSVAPTDAPTAAGAVAPSAGRCEPKTSAVPVAALAAAAVVVRGQPIDDCGGDVANSRESTSLGVSSRVASARWDASGRRIRAGETAAAASASTAASKQRATASAGGAASGARAAASSVQASTTRATSRRAPASASASSPSPSPSASVTAQVRPSEPRRTAPSSRRPPQATATSTAPRSTRATTTASSATTTPLSPSSPPLSSSSRPTRPSSRPGASGSRVPPVSISPSPPTGCDGRQEHQERRASTLRGTSSAASTPRRQLSPASSSRSTPPGASPSSTTSRSPPRDVAASCLECRRRGWSCLKHMTTTTTTPRSRRGPRSSSLCTTTSPSTSATSSPRLTSPSPSPSLLPPLSPSLSPLPSPPRPTTRSASASEAPAPPCTSRRVTFADPLCIEHTLPAAAEAPLHTEAEAAVLAESHAESHAKPQSERRAAPYAKQEAGTDSDSDSDTYPDHDPVPVSVSAPIVVDLPLSPAPVHASAAGHTIGSSSAFASAAQGPDAGVSERVVQVRDKRVCRMKEAEVRALERTRVHTAAAAEDVAAWRQWAEVDPVKGVFIFG